MKDPTARSRHGVLSLLTTRRASPSHAARMGSASGSDASAILGFTVQPAASACAARETVAVVARARLGAAFATRATTVHLVPLRRPHSQGRAATLEQHGRDPRNHPHPLPSAFHPGLCTREQLCSSRRLRAHWATVAACAPCRQACGSRDTVVSGVQPATKKWTH